MTCYTHHILDETHRLWYGVVSILIGVAAVLLNLWFIFICSYRTFLTSKTYTILLNLILSSLGQTLLTGIPFTATSTLAGRWLFGTKCCQLFSFLNLVFKLSQIFNITVLGIEELLFGKTCRTYKNLSLQTYVYVILLCWIMSTSMGLPPLLGIGRYMCDEHDISCDYDWTLNSKSYQHSVYTTVLFLVGHATPLTAACVCVCIGGTRSVDIREKSLSQIRRTLVWAVLILWVSQLIFITWTICVTEIHSLPVVPPPLVITASLSSEITSLIPVLVIMRYDTTARNAMIYVLNSFKKKIVIK